MKIYTVSHITYDYFRFEELIIATCNYNTALAAAREHQEKWESDYFKNPIIESVEASYNLNKDGSDHILIQTWEDN